LPRSSRLASAAGISRMKMLRQRISPPWVWSWIGPSGGIGTMGSVTAGGGALGFGRAK